MKPFRELLDDVSNLAFGEVIDRYQKLTEFEMEALRGVLQKIGFLGRQVTSNRLNQLEFFLSNFDEQVEKEDRGVLFASPGSGAYVDRPIVFYLGMDASWTRTVPDRPWIDHERQRQNNLVDFQVMLQNGEYQYYLVQEHQMNADVTPCFYFNVLFDDEFETFSDRDHRLMSGLPALEVRPGFDHEPREIEIDEVEAFSQSSLNKFVKSPRDYFFDKLVPTVENVYMRKGQIFHDFAEFYVNNPDQVREDEYETYVEIMVDAITDLTDEWSREDLRTEFRVGIRNIVEFLERHGYSVFQPEGYESNVFDRENIFAAERDNASISSPISEAWFESRELGIHGLVDLIPSEDRIVDFKSGRGRTGRKVVEQATVGRFDDDPDFQAILYLSYHRRRYPDRPLQFTFFYFLENVSDVLEEDDSLEDTLTTVTYYPRKFAEQVSREKTFEYLKESSKKRRKVLEGIGFSAYRDFFRNNEFQEYEDKDEAEESDLVERFASYARKHYKDAKYVTKQAKKTFRKLIDFRHRNFFKEDVDRFEEYLQSQLNKLNRCYEDGFPIENDVEDLDLDDLNNRDLIVDDRYE
jgi:hypothetical protein